MLPGESFPRQKASTGGRSSGAEVMNHPFTTLSLVKIPPETPESMVHEIHRSGGAPNSYRLAWPVVDAAEQAIEPANVIEMEVAEEQMIQLQNFGPAHRWQAVLSAIEEQAMLGLASVHLHPKRIVAPRSAKNLEFKCHFGCELSPDRKGRPRWNAEVGKRNAEKLEVSRNDVFIDLPGLVFPCRSMRR